MIEWWHSLLLETQIFYGIGIFSLSILLFQLLLTLLGFDGDHGDADFAAGDHDSGLGIFSARTVTAFFVGFGWTGAVLLNHGYSIIAAVAGGSAVGAIFLFATYFLIVNLLRLQSSGNLNYQNAIGVVGTVYSTIPGAEAGGGQLELLLQGRLMMAEAYTKSPLALPPNTKAKVVALIGQSTLLVEPLNPSSHA